MIRKTAIFATLLFPGTVFCLEDEQDQIVPDENYHFEQIGCSVGGTIGLLVPLAAAVYSFDRSMNAYKSLSGYSNYQFPESLSCITLGFLWFAWPSLVAWVPAIVSGAFLGKTIGTLMETTNKNPIFVFLPSMIAHFAGALFLSVSPLLLYNRDTNISQVGSILLSSGMILFVVGAIEIPISILFYKPKPE